MTSITLDIWPKDESLWDDGAEEVVEFDHVDTYPDMPGGPKGYHQFSGSTKEGQHLELRIPLDRYNPD